MSVHLLSVQCVAVIGGAGHRSSTAAFSSTEVDHAGFSTCFCDAVLPEIEAVTMPQP